MSKPCLCGRIRRTPQMSQINLETEYAICWHSACFHLKAFRTTNELTPAQLRHSLVECSYNCTLQSTKETSIQRLPRPCLSNRDILQIYVILNRISLDIVRSGADVGNPLTSEHSRVNLQSPNCFVCDWSSVALFNHLFLALACSLSSLHIYSLIS